MQRAVGLLSAQTWWSEPEITALALAMLLCRQRYHVEGETGCGRAAGWQACLSKVMAAVLNCSVHLVFPVNPCLNYPCAELSPRCCLTCQCPNQANFPSSARRGWSVLTKDHVLLNNLKKGGEGGREREREKEAHLGSTLFQTPVIGFYQKLHPSEDAPSSQLQLKVGTCFRTINEGDLGVRFTFKKRWKSTCQNTDLVHINGKGAKSSLPSSPMC